LEECTFAPNKQRSASANKNGRKNNHQRNPHQFLED